MAKKLNTIKFFYENKKKYQNDDDILMMHAARTIKKYAQCNEKIPLIKKFLEKTLKPKLHHDNTFIGPFPLSYYSSVSSGIYKFSNKIEDNHISDDSDDDE